MANTEFSLTDQRPKVVGSFGGIGDLHQAEALFVRDSCNLAEIRMDLMAQSCMGAESPPWRHLCDIPLLFTARCAEEGGNGNLAAAARIALLETALDDAACMDIEVASIPEMGAMIETLRARGIPWIASFHDFEKLPETSVLAAAASRAKAAGASVFKAAARLHGPADLARLAEFQLADHGIPAATMGMGPLAPVSRLLCAQCGSLLNYGYLGETPTAPGQWDAGFLKQAIGRLTHYDLRH
ncbi:MAG: type I 3-dehydroquinate dehydratase [Luteolibacter sp.]|jgi:3-dehydroquinate dehydratase-1|nr:type I 3-dehydroquinate dehydratase [Luteolibacter sp.]